MVRTGKLSGLYRISRFEVGPHTVLSDLLRRRWVDRPVFHTDGADALVSFAAAADLLPSCAPTS